MKLNFHDSFGKTTTYTLENAGGAPDLVRDLLGVDGVQSVFVCQDFITINRVPGAVWDTILAAAKQICTADSADAAAVAATVAATAATSDIALDAAKTSAPPQMDGQVSVLVQTFKGVPIQVKVLAPGAGAAVEKRVALAERFMTAAQSVQNQTNADFLKERYWADYGVRYGEPDEIAAQVADEIEGTIDDAGLKRLCDQATGKAAPSAGSLSAQERQAALSSADWHVRLRAVQELGHGEKDIALLARALTDEQMQVRRFAAAGLGTTGSSEAVAPLCKALLEDTAVAVRRTAGDALSDIGDVSAEADVCKALADQNKLVRWRACRFLSEVGTENALPGLESVLQDPEFEVRLEAQAAIERIIKGSKGLSPVWKRMHEGGSLP